MKPAFQLVLRQSGTIAFALFVFALACGANVCEGLWQGSGLHGYVVHQGKANQGYIVPVWPAFVQMLTAAALGATFSLIALRQYGVRLKFGTKNGECPKSYRRTNVLRNRRQKK